MRIITQLNAKQNFIGLIDNGLTNDLWQISVPQLFQVLRRYDSDSIDDTTDRFIGCGGVIMASHKAKPSAPRKKPEVKTSKPSKPAKAFRSTEFIEDSEEEATNVAKKKQTPKTTPSVNSSTKLTKPKAVTFSTKSSKTRKLPSPSPEKEESTQSDTGVEESSHSGDGSENEESSSAQDGSPTPARPKATASRPATNSAAAKASVGKSELNKAKAPGKGTNRISLSPRPASASKSEEDSESSGSGNESGSGSESSDQTSRKSSREESPIQKPITPREEQIIFEPPPGFDSASIVVHPSSQVMDIFSPTNLAGKEIWHIAAPSSIPISTIKELSQQKILSYEGSNYGLIPASSTIEALLLPSAEANQYKSHNAATIQGFHLQQILSLPYHAISPAKSSSQNVPTPQAHKRPPREQPKGLKMRYHPFGVVDISENEDVPKAPQFRVPGAVEDTPRKKRKRLSTDQGVQSPTVSSKSKSKKAKVRQEATVNEQDDVMDVDTVDKPASRKQDASEAKANGDLESHTPKSAKSKKTKQNPTDKKPDHPPPQPLASQSLLPTDIVSQAETIIPQEVVTTGASAIEITASEDKRTKRKRKKMEGAKTADEKQNVANADIDVEMQDADEIPSREPEGQSATPVKHSPQKHANTTNGEVDEIQETPQKKANGLNGEGKGVQVTPKETKEERRKRKEEKKRKKEAGKVV